jgi:hypothetical protein
MIFTRFRDPFATRCNLDIIYNLGMQERGSSEMHFESGVLQLRSDLLATMYICISLSPLSLSLSLSRSARARAHVCV